MENIAIDLKRDKNELNWE